MIYCDTSFLLAILLPGDFFHSPAKRVAARFTEPIPFTLLVELETKNGLRRALATRFIRTAEHDSAFRQIGTDLDNGILARMPLNHGEVFRSAGELSKRHTATTLARSLDILHLAAAMRLGAMSIASFDERQRKLALAAGVRVLPRSMP